MNVWLLHVGEDLPIDRGGREYRYGRLAQAFVDRGCHVTRWAPTVRHATKKQRATQDKTIELSDRFKLQLVHTRSYCRNISLARWHSYRDMAIGFSRLAAKQEPPDLIVTAIPTPALCEAAIEYGRRNQIPVVVDVRDLWPDVYLTAIPDAFETIGRYALAPAFKRVARVCRQADALVAVSDTYLSWALELAGRSRNKSDRVIPIGYDAHRLSEEDRRHEQSWLIEQGVDPNKTICLYAGLLEKSYDLTTVLQTAERFKQAGRKDVQFVLCGDGGRRASLEKQAERLDNVVFLGWVRSSTVATAMEWSKIGLAAYATGALQSLPNKPFEYMAGGLAILSSLGGELRDILESSRCGDYYEPGNSLQLHESISRLTADPAHLLACGQRARQLFESQFTSHRIYTGAADHLLRIRPMRQVSNKPRANHEALQPVA